MPFDRLRVARGAFRLAAFVVAFVALAFFENAVGGLFRPGVSWRVAMPWDPSVFALGAGVTCERTCQGVVSLGLLAYAAFFLAAGLLALWGLLARRARILRLSALAFGLAMGLLAAGEAITLAARPGPAGPGAVLDVLLAMALYVGAPVALLLLAAKTHEGAAPRPPLGPRLAALVGRWRDRYAALAEEGPRGADGEASE